MVAVRRPRFFVVATFSASSATFAACGHPTNDFGAHTLGTDAGATNPGDDENTGQGAGAGSEKADPAARYQPLMRVDTDNVSAYGDPPQALKLPDPPKSGFRIVAPPRTMKPGEELETCIAWPFPKVLTHRNVYAARLYTTPGLHHSNVISKPVDAKRGPSLYPRCNPGAADPFGDLPAVIPDTLFANTTQVKDGESLVFPPGMAFKVDPTREIATDIHYLNASQAPLVVEVAYDFFTMPDDLLEHEVVPFALDIGQFLVPPHAQKDIGTECPVFGGNVVSLMAHTHQFADEFSVDLVGKDESVSDVYDIGAQNSESVIRTYDPPIDLSNTKSIRYDCAFDNTTSHPLRWGIGENEMCVLFGYLYPPSSQFVAHAPDADKPCQSLQIGLLRGAR